jgi:HPt (histidine-containing phosphotransfer) domain-containing protein
MKWQFQTETHQSLVPGLHPTRTISYRDQVEDAPVFDYDELMERVGHDEQLLCEIIALFHEDAPARIVELEAALSRLDCVAFERAAHALKGMLSNFAAQPATETAYTLEIMGHSHRWMNANQLLSKLEQQIEDLNRSLRGLQRKVVS